MNVLTNPTPELLEALIGTADEIAPNVVRWCDGSLWVVERDFYGDWSHQHSQYVESEFIRATRIPGVRYNATEKGR